MQSLAIVSFVYCVLYTMTFCIQYMLFLDTTWRLCCIVYLIQNTYAKCAELGWRCVPLAVETYCNWGEEARGTFALLATRLAFGYSSFRKARVISDMLGRLNITLVRAIARAILARTVIPSDFN